MSRYPITAKYDLTLFAIATSGQIQLHLDYNTDLFSCKRIVEMLEQLHHLLAQIVDKPDERISRYSLVTRTAQALLPDPRIALDTSWHGAVDEIFADYAHKQPERLAVQDARETWTYQELNDRSNQLARCLQGRGIRPGEIVAVYAHRSATLVWALLGILKAGAAFCVIDPAHPAARVGEYLSAAAPKALIQIAAAGVPTAEMERALNHASVQYRVALPSLASAQARQFLSSYETENPHVATGPDDLAYVAFTSGSTGKPKAVSGRHGPLTHFSPWLSDTFTLSASDRFSMLSGLSFNLLHREIFTPLTVGAALCIPDSDDIAPGRLAHWINRQAISIVHLTPAMGQILLRGEKMALPSLRCLFFGGDLVRKSDVETFQELNPQLTIMVFYGATETQRAVGHFIIPAKHDQIKSDRSLALRQVMPLGRGIPGVQLWVLNPDGQMSGIGELGEICVRSPHLAKGYLDDERLTQERFIVNPFTGITDDRVYRTGEQGRYLPDGQVDFVARAQDRASIRGFRIELGEIETVLSEHPAVREAVIAAREDSTGDSRLVGYVVTKSDGAAPAGDFRVYLKEKLPDYMIPSTFVFLPQLPLSASGKVDRGALPVPENVRPGLPETFVAPRTPMEIIIAEAWKSVLGVDRVGRHDNFFDLGGHSLLSMQAIARIKEKTGTQIHPKAFVTQTVAQLATVYEKQVRRQTQTLSFTQKLWRSLRNAMFHHKNTE
jgi:amino acid adenylation domain-containing protein